MYCISEIKVDCIRVSCIPIKSIIDDHIQRLFDALLGSLRRSIQTDVTEIDSYLTEAMDTLSQRPQTIEEIGDANVKHVEYAKKKKEVCLSCLMKQNNVNKHYANTCFNIIFYNYRNS